MREDGLKVKGKSKEGKAWDKFCIIYRRACDPEMNNLEKNEREQFQGDIGMRDCQREDTEARQGDKTEGWVIESGRKWDRNA